MVSSEKIKNIFGRLAYYLIHGFLLLLISFVFWFFQISYMGIFVSSIWAIGALQMVGVTILLGLLNSTIAERMWHLNLRSDSHELLFHGLKVLVPTQLLFYLFPVIMNIITFDRIVTQAIFWELIIVLYCFTFGFIGKYVADQYQKEPIKEKERKVHLSEGTRSVCTRCGASHVYPKSSISQNNTVRCYTCGKEFGVSSTEELLKQLGESTEPTKITT